MINKVIMAGRLTADPEMRNAGESRYCRFTIAVQKKGKEKNEADFFNCIAWNRNADTICSFFSKGEPIMIVGSLNTNRYEKNGEKRTYYEIRVGEIHFFGRGNKAKKNEENQVDNGMLF